jgi:hypothetical protein
MVVATTRRAAGKAMATDLEVLCKQQQQEVGTLETTMVSCNVGCSGSMDGGRSGGDKFKTMMQASAI